MNSTPRVYVFTVNSPSRKHVRLWTGNSLHALRHCSAKLIGQVLMEMRQEMEALEKLIERRPSGGSYSLNRSR